MSSQPLNSYKVLDLSRVRAGPTAVRQLGDWGAQIIKIEMPKDDADDDDDTDRSDYQNMQRNKRSIAINLKDKDGVEILKQLVRTADIFIESFRPDVKYRLGIDYETLRQINPRLIYASISGFGQTGPYQNRPGYDQVIQGKFKFNMKFFLYCFIQVWVVLCQSQVYLDKDLFVLVFPLRIFQLVYFLPMEY
jgi:crotonobetainyl-CoA:carnitine CoA-transferase CaiB-like acyl-CoA transferase